MPDISHCHGVQFYQSQNSLAASAARFLSEGILKQNPAVMIATPKHAVAITDELSTLGLNVHDLRKSARLNILDARKVLETFMVDDMPDQLLFKSNVGDLFERITDNRLPCSVRAYGEMVDVLWKEGNREGAIRLEVLWNQLASSYDFDLMCGYAIGQFYKETDGRSEIERLHSHVISD